MSLETAITTVECHSAQQQHVVPTTHERIKQVWRFTLRTVFIAMLAIYVSWNLYWLAQLQIAPSMFQALTGFPCPTTGCTRSFFALGRGEWQESLRFNALLIPICAITIASLLQLFRQAVTRRRLALSRMLVILWGIVLPIAWILKLAGDPHYW